MSAGAGVKVPGRYVGRAGEDPCLHAPEPHAVIQQGIQQAAADPLALVGWRNSHFVDPQLSWFVRMHVVDPRGKAYDHMIVERHHEVMARIVEELGSRLRENSVIEDPRRNAVENGAVADAQ